MKINLLSKIYLGIILLFIYNTSFCQIPFQLQDGRGHKYCQPCIQIIQSMPKEVLFGVAINPKGDVYFSITNREWFDKIFKNNSYGISIDLVSKDRYNCNTETTNSSEMPRGTLLKPIYRQEMLDTEEEGYQNAIMVKVGKVPVKLIGKKIEANIAILNGTFICHYTNFLNIDRSVWQLLPMGLFTDSLLNSNGNEEDNLQKDFFTYSKKIEIKIPFEKASATFGSIYLKGLYDSLELSKYKIKKTEIRTYSSVEGPEQTNYLLMKRRADTIIKALKNYEPSLTRIKVLTAENWIDFFTDIEETSYSDLLDLSKTDIKQKLKDKTIAENLEPILSKERKAFVTIYLESKTEVSKINNDALLSNFNDAIKKDDIQEARKIQKEIVERIMDNKIPFTYMSQLEVPETKSCVSLLSDRETYKYLLKATDEYEALKSFVALQKLDPSSGKINYNVCALRFFVWRFGNDSISRKMLLPEINKLQSQGINKTLVKRMLINYQILKSEENMQKGNYAGKDSAVNTIRKIYRDINWSDEDIYSIAKYYAYYAHYDWALEITTPRIDKLDISEDLVFYYVNLLFFYPSNFDDDAFRKATLNAINLNKKRFCNFFLPIQENGAGMQLLEYETLKAQYCDACKGQ